MPDLQLAVDCSNFQGDLGQDVFERWHAEGCRTVICGTDGSQSSPNVFLQQSAKARAAGLNVEAYMYLWYDLDVAARARIKLDLIQQAGGIERVWLDVEDTFTSKGPGEIVGLTALARDLVLERGFQTGIYTGRWYWVPRTNDSAGFSNLPLWLASYDGQQNLDMPPMGGWTAMYRKQFTDKGSLGGVSPLDLNIEAAPIAPPPPQAPDAFQVGRREMFDAWVRETENHLAWVKSREGEWSIR